MIVIPVSYTHLFQEMLEKTIAEYHERRKHLTAEEAGEAQEKASEDIIKIATEQVLACLLYTSRCV